MKTSKLLYFISLITFASLFYVWQQTEIVRLAYVGQKTQVLYQDLLDKNTVLRYNIGKNASLVNIAGRIAGRADFQLPDSYRLVRLASSDKVVKIRQNYLPPKESLFSRVFGLRREAQAKTVP